MAWTKEQKEAIEKSGTNIIVSAGAGSGKTAVLSERVIHKLQEGIHIDELLILTFTRAAADEMKERIRDNIKSNPELKNELDALDSAYITTFDSFALSIVKKYHYLANIPKDIAITDETIVTLEKDRIIDRVFERAYKKRSPRFTNLLRNFTIKDDTPIKSAISSLVKKIDTYLNKREYIDYLKNSFFEKENVESLLKEFREYVEEKKKTLKLELENAYSFFTPEYIEKIDAVLLPLINTSTYEELQAFQTIKLPSLPRGSEDETKNAKEKIKQALDELIGLCSFGTENEIEKSILDTRETILAFVELLEDYYDELDTYKRANDIYTFNDIALLAIEILKNSPAAREELRDKFKEIMIDEYQDTNDIQETLISLFSNDNVYMVGDIKQSIYRFRGSNPSIFKDKYDHYSKDEGGYKIDLIKNFRSRKEVLDNINAIFALLMDDELGGAAYTVSHEMVYGNENYDNHQMPDYDYNFKILEYEPYEKSDFTNVEIEAFAIAKDIEKKMLSHAQVFDKKSGTLRPFKYSDAVIILDRSTFFDTYKKIFEYLGIPLTILRDEKLTTSTETYLIKNIIDFIIRIKNRDYGLEFKYDLMSIGRSFLYEYTDEYLFELISTSSFKDSTLYKDFADVENLNSMTPTEIIDYIIDKTDLYGKICKIGDYENTNLRIMKIRDIANSLAELGRTIEEFKDYLSEIIDKKLEIKYTAYSGDADSVKILTIHKSKGLEYAFCYFADLDHNFNTKELREKFISDLHYGIITPISVENEDDSKSILKILYTSKFMKDEIGEKIRLFYVALTRAREQFTILIPKADTTKLERNRVGTIELIRRLKFKGLNDFLLGIKDYLPYYFHELDKEQLTLTKDYLFNKTVETDLLDSTSKKFAVTELSFSEDITEKKRFSKDLPELLTKETIANMEFGTRIHRVLEFVDFKNYDSSLIKDEFIRKKVDALYKSSLFEHIDEAKIYHEYEFVYDNDEATYHGSIDLMLEYSSHIDIIDYKLKNTQDKHYLDQLAGYKRYIESISSKPVHTYLYSIIDEKVFPLD